MVLQMIGIEHEKVPLEIREQFAFQTHEGKEAMGFLKDTYGLFVKELDKALAEGRVDICVHSLKDLPMEIPAKLPIVCFSKREDPRDVLLLKAGGDETIGSGIIGTSSNRRKIQLKRLYPKAEFKGIRGNVQTRLRKLEEEDYTATVLARAGLMRLEMENVIARTFSVEEMIPAAGQGILAVQGRMGEDYSYLNGIHSQASAYMAEAERGFVATCVDRTIKPGIKAE